MPQLTLTLNGYLVDLPADAAVALSYRANDLRNIESREASFSETFTLPITARNAAVLGNPHSLDSLTTTPYRFLPAVLTSPGGVAILNGFALLELSHEGYDVTLMDALGALFAQVGDLVLRELDLSQYDHVLSYASVHAANGNDYRQGYTYPLADTGALTYRDPAKGVGFDELPAAVYYHTILRAIVKAALPGYQIIGSLLAEDTYRRAVLPRATAYPQLRASYLEPYRVLARTSGTIEHKLASGDVAIAFAAVEHGQLFAGLYYAPPPHPISLKIEATVRVRRGAVQLLTAPFLRLVVQDAQGVTDILGQSLIKANSTSTVTITAQVPYLAATSATQIFLQLHWLGNAAGDSLTVLPGGKLTIEVQPRAFPGAPVHLAASLPELSQADFLKLVFNQFNVLTQADPVLKTVRFDLFNDLDRNRNRAVDWTARLDFTQRPRLAYVLGEYAQRNLLAYAETPEAYEEELALPAPPRDDAARGRATLPALNATLPSTAEAFAADLFLPLRHQAAGDSLLWLPFFTYKQDVPVSPYDENANYDNSSGIIAYQGQLFASKKGFPFGGYSIKPPRVGDDWLLVADMDVFTIANQDLLSVALVEPYAPSTGPLQVKGLGGSSYVPAHGLTRDGLSFADLLPAYFPGLANILQRVQLLTLDVRLSPLDILNLDFTRPVRISVPHVQGYGKLSALLYLNNIDQLIPGQPGPVACTFLVLGLPVPGLAPAVPNPPVKPLRILADEDKHLLSTDDGYLLLAQY